MRTELLKKAIGSLDYRKYVEENKIKLSDWDLATLIYHNKMLTHKEMLENLQILANSTEDKNLELQIRERIELDHENFLLFKQVSENAYYRLSYWFEPRGIVDVFTNFESAYNAVLEELCPMRISRCVFDDKERESGVWGTIEFSPNGQMENYFYLWRSGKENFIDDGSKSRFEGRGLNLPMMFRTGDIVYNRDEDAYGIVMTPTDDKDEEFMRQVASYEYVDFQVPVDYVYREDHYQTVFRHEHVSPANLEYARFRDNDCRKGFLEYLAQGILMEAGKEPGIRKPQRMDEVLHMIKEIWEQYPDFRLGQLLVNICGKKDLFYVEDEELVKGLQRNKFPIEEK